MNKRLLQSAAVVLLLAGSMGVQAQTSKKTDVKKGEDIVIRKKDSSKEKYTIVIDGDNVTINGKPVEDFKGNDVQVYRRDDAQVMVLPRLMAPGGAKMFRPHKLQVNRAMLGVSSNPVDKGARITSVSNGSAAEKAGLKEDDIITQINSKPINDTTSLVEAINAYQPGDSVTITYLRDGKTQTTNAVLGKNEFNFQFNTDGNAGAFAIPDMNFNFGPDTHGFNFTARRGMRAGLQVQETENAQGVKVLDVQDDSPADKAGLKEGDIINSINGKNIASIDDVRGSLGEVKEGDSFDIAYTRNNQQLKATLKFPKKLKTTNL